MQDAELITTTGQLEQLAVRLLKADAVAADTEFFWERTFYPVLGLVQLATAEGCWLIDAVRIRDLSALGPVLASAAITKILHDAPQDLGILARATGAMPRTVFDTRLAAGFARFSSTCSLQALLCDALGIELEKAETRSDWLRRPLSTNQLRYAADDVLHLIPLREKLLAGCADDTVRGWLHEDLARLDDPALYSDRDPRLMYLRVKGTSSLNPRQLAVLRELAAWREAEARQRDWPRGHVLQDSLLVAVAQRNPADRNALFRDVPDFPHKMPDDVLIRLLKAAACGLAVPNDECPQPSGLDFAAKHAVKAQSDRLLAHIKAACEPFSVDPALVASRAEVEGYVSLLGKGPVDNHPLSQGWRKTFVGDYVP